MKTENEEYLTDGINKQYNDCIDGIPMELTTKNFGPGSVITLEEFWLSACGEKGGDIYGYQTSLGDVIDLNHAGVLYNWLGREEREAIEDIAVLREEVKKGLKFYCVDKITEDDPVLLISECDVDINGIGVFPAMIKFLEKHYPMHTSVMQWPAPILLNGDFKRLFEREDGGDSCFEAFYDEFRHVLLDEYKGFCHPNDISSLLPGFFVHYGEHLWYLLKDMNEIYFSAF